MSIFIATMIRYLIAFVTFCSLFNRSYGQSPAAAIDSLIKFRVITVKERPALEKELKENRIASYKVVLLYGLKEVMLQKTLHIKPHTFDAFLYKVDSTLNKKSRDSINTSLRTLLEKIKKAGLLSDRVYSYTLSGIDSGRYMADVQMISVLAEMSSRLEWLTPDKLLPVAEDLHKNGIVSDSSFIRLKNDIGSGKIESSFQLNDYCRLDRTFDLTKYPDDPDIWLEKLHRDIASILPELNFTDFNYTIIPDTASSFASLLPFRFMVSLKCDGRIYRHATTPFLRKPGEAKVSPGDILLEDFYRIFNKVLADQQSPFRLHALMFSHVGSAGGNLHQFALIALREEQTEVFYRKPCLTYVLLGMEDYDNTLTSAKVDSVIAGWKTLGLFAHLSNPQINRAIDNAQADNLFSIGNLLYNFPEVLYNPNGITAGPHYTYTDQLTHLAGITHGVFNPTHIKQRKKNGGIRLQYLAEGRIHSYIFKSKDGWLDAGFPAFVKGLGQENNLPGNFYQLDSGIIYLTIPQHDEAVKNNLLDFWDGKTRERRKKI